ncbi:MAG: response regulator, partial [Proteobacteria bacterium]|nr:response regulator [Pseudomonadota bacterium]
EIAQVVLGDLMPEVVVHRASDGEEAIRYLENCCTGLPEARKPWPDLILLDLRMPKVDGLEVLKRIKTDSATRSIPVVVLTTSSANADVERAYDLGVNSYLVKPAGYDAFSKLLSQFGKYWFNWNRKPIPIHVS